MTHSIRSLFSAILVVALCATTLLRPGLAEVSITPPFSIDLTKCWSSILNSQGCETQIIKSVLTGKFENIGPACCKVFTEVDAKCWPTIFPLNPLFSPLLKDVCAQISAVAPIHTTNKFSVAPVSPIYLTKCLSSLVNVQGCLTEIYKSVSTGKFGNIGPMCYKAFLAVDARCWPQMLPLNPFFPPLLKNEYFRMCSTPTHK